MPNTDTIAVAMSGGVDSSTVAAMLRADGHNVIGLTMQLWNQRRLAGREGMPESVQGRCCSLDDVLKRVEVDQLVLIFLQRMSGDEEAEDLLLEAKALMLVPIGCVGQRLLRWRDFLRPAGRRRTGRAGRAPRPSASSAHDPSRCRRRPSVAHGAPADPWRRS